LKRLPHILPDPGDSTVRLRLAETADAELLRVWKNANKHAFFYKQDIPPQQQAEWFRNYLERPDDHLYLVEERTDVAFEPVGVLGARLIEGTVDIYNVIRGRHTGGKANMGRALRVLLDAIDAHYREPISCKVLSDNPANAWYMRHGFAIAERFDDYNLLTYQRRRRLT
jgi:ribosomal protein S18 acetylase RimI-like enzyme